MTDLKITIENIDTRHGRYAARADGVEGTAEITFTRRANGVISADHTGVPDSMRSTGAGLALVAYMVEDARKNGFRILPLCPYVRAQYRRHPDWADVMTLAPGEEPSL